MLDIHSGQRALREAGLIDQFHAIARREGQDLRLLEEHLPRLLATASSISADRARLDSLPITGATTMTAPS